MRKSLLLLLPALTVVVVVVLLCYMRWVARENLELTQHCVAMEQWQEGDSVKIAVLTDIHARPVDGAYLDAVVRHTLEGKPDAVLLPGDFMNGHHAEEAMPPEVYYLRTPVHNNRRDQRSEPETEKARKKERQ